MLLLFKNTFVSSSTLWASSSLSFLLQKHIMYYLKLARQCRTLPPAAAYWIFIFNQGCSAKERSVRTHQKKLVIFNNTSNSSLTEQLGKYSLSIHCKQKHEKSVGTSFPSVPVPLYPYFQRILTFNCYQHSISGSGWRHPLVLRTLICNRTVLKIYL